GLVEDGRRNGKERLQKPRHCVRMGSERDSYRSSQSRRADGWNRARQGQRGQQRAQSSQRRDDKTRPRLHRLAAVATGAPRFDCEGPSYVWQHVQQMIHPDARSFEAALLRDIGERLYLRKGGARSVGGSSEIDRNLVENALQESGCGARYVAARELIRRIVDEALQQVGDTL